MKTVTRKAVVSAMAVLLIVVASAPLAQASSDLQVSQNCFTDVSTSDWFHDFVCWMYDSGLSSGYPDGTFRPNNNITRAEVSVFAQRGYELAEESDDDTLAGLGCTTDQIAKWVEGEWVCSGALATGYVSIPAASFVPEEDGCQFDPGSVAFVSGYCNFLYHDVRIPDGATITKLTIGYWDGNTNNDVSATLFRIPIAGSGEFLAAVSSTGASVSFAYQTASTEAIAHPEVDNAQYSYLVMVELPDFQMQVHAVQLEYSLFSLD